MLMPKAYKETTLTEQFAHLFFIYFKDGICILRIPSRVHGRFVYQACEKLHVYHFHLVVTSQYVFRWSETCSGAPAQIQLSHSACSPTQTL